MNCWEHEFISQNKDIQTQLLKIHNIAIPTHKIFTKVYEISNTDSNSIYQDIKAETSKDSENRL